MKIAFAVYEDTLLGVGEFDRLLDMYDSTKQLLVETTDPGVIRPVLFLDIDGAVTREAFDFEGRERPRIYEVEVRTGKAARFYRE